MNNTPRTDAAIDAMSRDVSGFTEFVSFTRGLELENVTFRNAQKACEDCDAPTLAETKQLRADNAALREANARAAERIREEQQRTERAQAEAATLKSENNRLREDTCAQTIAALRADKERLDWMDKNELDAVYEQGDPDVGLFPVWQICGRSALVSNGMKLIAFESSLRAAIDAARAALGKECAK